MDIRRYRVKGKMNDARRVKIWIELCAKKRRS